MNAIIEAWNGAAAVWWDWTVTATWQGTLFFALVVLLLVSVKALGPRFRYGLLLLVLLKLALPPVVGLSYGFSDLLTRMTAMESVPMMDSGKVSVMLGDASPDDLKPIAAGALSAPAHPSLTWTGWLLLLQLLGAVAVMGLIIRQVIAVRRLLRESSPATGETHERLAGVAARMGVGRLSAVYASPQVSAPQSCGIRRSVIVLPEWAEAMPVEELDILLAHELAHERRKDALVNSFQAFIQAILWWNPAVWWLNNRIREERELCCDDFVLSRGVTSGATYSRVLVAVAEQVSMGQRSWVMTGMADGFGCIGRRVRRAMEGGKTRTFRSRAVGMILIAVLAGWVLPGATQAAGRAEEPQLPEIVRDEPPAPAEVPATAGETPGDGTNGAPTRTKYRLSTLTADSITRTDGGMTLENASFVLRYGSSKFGEITIEAAETLELKAQPNLDRVHIEGSLRATYRGMTIEARGLRGREHGTLEFSDAVVDSEAFEQLSADRIDLNLTDGKIALPAGGKVEAMQVDEEAALSTRPENAAARHESPVPTVRIETRIVEVDVDEAKAIIGGGVAPVEYLVRKSDDSPYALIAADDWPKYERELDALSKASKAKVLSSPSVVTPDEMEASITTGMPVPVAGERGVRMEDLGTTLRVLPSVAKGRLDLFYERTVKAPEGAKHPTITRTIERSYTGLSNGRDYWLLLGGEGTTSERMQLVFIHPEILHNGGG